MIKLGVLSVPKDKKSIIKKIIAPLSIKEQFVDKFDITVVEIALTAKELSKLPKLLKRYVLKRGKRFIDSLQLNYISMTLEFSNGIGIEGKTTAEVDITHCYMKSAIELLKENLKDNPMDNNVLIVDTKGRNLDISLFSGLYDKINRLGIVTDNQAEAEKFEEKLMDNYGLCPEIINGFMEEMDFVYAVDMNKYRVKTGRNSYVDKMEMGLNINGYDINVSRLVKDYPDIADKLTFIKWVSRKNLLTTDGI